MNSKRRGALMGSASGQVFKGECYKRGVGQYVSLTVTGDVELWVDAGAILRSLTHRALLNKSGKASYMAGAITVYASNVVRTESEVRS